MEVTIAIIAIVGGIAAIIAIEIVLDYAWFLAQRGWTHKEAGRFEQALADFNRAGKLKPRYKWTVAGRGQLQRLQKRHNEALADFDRVITNVILWEWNRPMTYTPPKLLTFEEFVALYGDNTRYKVIDGERKNMEPTGPHEAVAGSIAGRIYVELFRSNFNVPTQIRLL